ncbi:MULTISPECIES: hemerythrin domain-containing protein [Streptomyces]|uniref:Hemerythrin domain-containing protein n=1 Tax=Streptomyces gibsoniae TaxID=3075529 RepID=A0ABU2TZK0_9ACTN|nr:hemerythrin domain-containing protein [Streptomyces sp. DSM 41699]MDT0466231.1 hemerythrin domain-containing protein [Streptomyces sp. DSM 41699]
MDAIELLKHDHRMVEQLFRDYRSAASGRQRRAVVETLVQELSRHTALEELMVYPLAKRVLPDGVQEIEELLSEHMAAKKTLLALDKLSVDDDREEELVEQLRQEIEDHVHEEEGELLPRLRDAVSEQDLDRLGELLTQARQTAPTRPHPHAPDEPPALSLAGPVAAAYDRLRDRLQGRPRT